MVSFGVFPFLGFRVLALREGYNKKVEKTLAGLHLHEMQT